MARQQHQPWLFSPELPAKLLVVNPDGDALSHLPADAWCFHAGHAKHWPQAFCQASAPDLSGYQGVLVIAAKEQPLNQWVLNQLQQAASGTTIWLAGEKRGGISSLVKRLPANYSQPQKVASANNCQLFQASLLSTARPATEAPLQHRVELTDLTLTIASLPGVFSRQRLDQGTELLLETIPHSLPHPVVDFACGNGVISAVIEHRQSPVYAATDVNPMAVAATQLNVSSDTQVLLSDGLPSDLPPLACIVTNPPFHTGLQTDYQIVQDFVIAAFQALRSGGQLYLVANRFLPWSERIQHQFGHCQILADDGKFRVYFAQRR